MVKATATAGLAGVIYRQHRGTPSEAGAKGDDEYLIAAFNFAEKRFIQGYGHAGGGGVAVFLEIHKHLILTRACRSPMALMMRWLA